MGTKTQKLSNVVDQIVEWQSVFTGDGSTGLTAVAGRGYFINTTSGTVTVTLPASPSAGDVVILKDYARTWGTNAVSIASALFDGVTKSNSFSTEGQTVTIVYMDGTKGWTLINEDTTSNLGALYVTATGGTITTSGDYKIHTFTGDGCFVVSCAGNPTGSTSVDYLVIAGGGGGGDGAGASVNGGGGAGAGGYRESSGAASGCYTASPLGACVAALPVSVQTYPITIGAGGTTGNNGNNSIFSTITSAAGGKGGNGGCSPNAGSTGGSGGGHNTNPGSGSAGNTPPVSPPQGNNGGAGNANFSGGGGGAGAVGGDGGNPSSGTPGTGATSSINGTPTTRAAGGAGTTTTGPAASPQAANTGNGGGGSGSPGRAGGTGGSGIVIIRYKFQ